MKDISQTLKQASENKEDILNRNKLPLMNKLGYATGGLGGNLASNAISFYLVFYLTTVVGVSPVEAGLLVGTPSVLLAALDPVSGFVSDRVRSRLGQRRLIMLIFSPLMGASFFLLFFAPFSWNLSILVSFWFAAQLAYGTSATLVNTSYSAMAAELTPSSIERIKLISMQQGFGVIGTIIGSALTLLVVEVFGGGIVGFASMGIIFGAMIILCYLTVFAVTSAEPRMVVQQPSIWKEIRLIFRLRLFWLQFGITFLSSMIPVTINNILIFYLNYVHGITGSMLSSVLLVAMIGGLLSLPLWNSLCRRWEQRSVFAVGVSFYALVLLSFRFVPDHNTFLLWPLAILAGAGSIPLTIFPKSMATDVVAYDQSHQGRSRAGSIMGLLGLSSRAGTASGNILVGWLLAFVGYTSAMQTSVPLKEGLRVVMGFVPSAFLLVIIPFSYLYPLSRVVMAKVEERLNSQNTRRSLP